MKRIDAGQTITILANIGVIVGNVFLAIEINQSNRSMLSQTRSEISKSITDMLLAKNGDTDAAALMFRGER